MKWHFSFTEACPQRLVAALGLARTLGCSGPEAAGYADPPPTDAATQTSTVAMGAGPVGTGGVGAAGTASSYGTLTTTEATATTAAADGSGGARAANSGVTTGSPVAPSYSEVAALLGKTCGVAACHGKKQLPLIKDDPALPATLLGTTVEDCGHAPLVSPGQPETSALIMLVQRQCATLVMPEGCTVDPCLPQNALDTIATWIAAGAVVP